MISTVIENGRIFDPSQDKDEIGRICIEGRRIVAYDESRMDEKTEFINAKGNLILPGLIDFHSHLAFGFGDVGLHADLMAFPNGITSAVDAGSAGSVTFDGFVRYIIPSNETTIKAFCHVAPVGVMTDIHGETNNTDHYDIDLLRNLMDKYYPDQMIGLKIRLGRLFTPGLGVKPLTEAKKIAEELGCPVCCHLNDSEIDYKEVLDVLGAGDILCHCYQGRGKTILGEDGKVIDAAWEARKKGVYFDAACGRINHSLDIIQEAMREGFLPDLIGTDTIFYSVYQHKLFALPYVMSYMLDAGMDLKELIRSVTQTPARLMLEEGRRGTLKEGAFADIAVFQLAEHEITYHDQIGGEMKGNHLFIPMATWKEGRAVYKRIDFEFWD